jgi:hypothetical protein
MNCNAPLLTCSIRVFCDTLSRAAASFGVSRRSIAVVMPRPRAAKKRCAREDARIRRSLRHTKPCFILSRAGIKEAASEPLGSMRRPVIPLLRAGNFSKSRRARGETTAETHRRCFRLHPPPCNPLRNWKVGVGRRIDCRPPVGPVKAKQAGGFLRKSGRIALASAVRSFARHGSARMLRD